MSECVLKTLACRGLRVGPSRFGSDYLSDTEDPRVPLQRSKLENQENDLFGVKKCLFGGSSWNHLNGYFGSFNSLPQY